MLGFGITRHLFYFKINTENALRNIFDDMRVKSVAL